MIKNTFCSRCEQGFFTAYVQEEAQCPYCGFIFQMIGYSNIRSCKRRVVDAPADITRGKIRFAAQIFDLSTDGVGIRVKDKFPCDAGDLLHVTIQNHDIDSDACVVWIDESEDCMSRAGLKFRL